MSGRRGSHGHRHHSEAQAWSAQTPTRPPGYIASSPPKPASCLTCWPVPRARIGGEEIAKRLNLEKGAHGVAGILAWPGRYSRHPDRTLPIATEGRADGGTDYYMEPELAELFTAARAASPPTRRRRRRPRRER